MNGKIVVSLIFVLGIMLFSGVEFASAEGNVGVVVGQTADYTYAISRTWRDSNGTLITATPFTVDYIEKITILQISGTNVTFEFDRDLLNETEETGTSWVNVSDGNGTGTNVIISANINEGTRLYTDWTNENGTSEGAYSVNETILMKYGDSMMEVNHLNLTYWIDDQPCSQNWYWEKSTGLIIKWIISGQEVLEDGTVEALNIHFQRVGLKQIFYPYIDSKDYPVAVESDSTILGFEFNQTERILNLKLTGKTGTPGSCDIIVPDNLLWGTFSLSMDGYNLVEGEDYTKNHNGTHYTFDSGYIHSTHTIEIEASEAIAEIPVWMILPLFMTATLLAVKLYRKRLRSLPTH